MKGYNIIVFLSLDYCLGFLFSKVFLFCLLCNNLFNISMHSGVSLWSAKILSMDLIAFMVFYTAASGCNIDPTHKT